MGAGKASATEAPFGYTFDTSTPPNTTSSYPPPGPPLLDNNELGYLESFFEDPSNLDSNIPSFPGDYQGESGNIFSNTNVEWANQGLSNASNNAPSVPQDAGQISQPEQRRQIPASADVYAAAGILHGNTMRQQPSSSYNNAFSAGFGSTGPEGSQMNGYGYGTGLNDQGGEYDFGAGDNGFYNGYDEQDTSNPYMASLEGRLQDWNGGRASSGLNFGSDDNFRNSNYSGRLVEGPDKQLVEAVKYNFGHGKDGRRSRTKKGASGQRSGRKRDRRGGSTEEAAASDDNDDDDDWENSSGLGSRHQKRRKGKEEDEEGEDGDFEESMSKGKKSKKRRSSGGQISGSAGIDDGSASSPMSKKQKAAAAAAAIAKERRENLTEEQKRSNHIQSEQKRRNLIKQGFEDLNRMVPELRSNGLSKSNMLVQAASFMRRLRDENEELRLQMQSLDKG